MDPQQKKSIAQFSPQAEKYARAASFQGCPDLEFAIQHVAPKKEWRMLDIATGGGHTAFYFSPFVGSVIATDLTPEMLAAAEKVAAERGLVNIEFQRTAAEKLPFPDSSFDLVTCRIAPHHFSNIDAFIEESKRVLRSNGTFLVIDGIGPEIAEASTLYNNWERTRDPSHVRCLSISEWKERILAGGFTISASTEVTRPHEFRSYMDRMSVPHALQEKLLNDLLSIQEIKTWLQPINDNGQIRFYIKNGVFICR